jgi:hypothetical protein
MSDVATLNLARQIAMFNAEANVLENGNVLFCEDKTKQIKKKMIERDKLVFIIRSKTNNINVDTLLSNPDKKIKNTINIDELCKLINQQTVHF